MINEWDHRIWNKLKIWNWIDDDKRNKKNVEIKTYKKQWTIWMDEIMKENTQTIKTLTTTNRAIVLPRNTSTDFRQFIKISNWKLKLK